MQGFYEFHRDGMTQAQAWAVRDNQFGPHFHHSVELAYVLEGEICATLNGETVPVGAGSMLALSTYVVHSFDTPRASHIIVATIPLTVVPQLQQTLLTQAFESPVCPDDAEGTLRRLMEMLVRHQGNAAVAKGVCYTLLGLLMERVGMVPARTQPRAAFIRDVLAYLQAHHTEMLSAGQVAAHFGYSRSRFSHLFQAQLGVTLMAYVGAIRCRRAAQLLAETEMPVAEVAMAVGFESLRTFYRAFKGQYNMTPNQYARRQQP